MFPPLDDIFDLPISSTGLQAQASDDAAQTWVYLDSLFPFQRLLEHGKTLTVERFEQQPGRVAVIGAGVSGLCAAYELLRCGIKPTIFEAGPRIGGRLWTQHFRHGNAFAELGGMRVPETHRVYNHYIEHFGLEQTPFPNPGAPTHLTRLYFDDERYDYDLRDCPLDCHPLPPPPAPFKTIKQGYDAFIKKEVGALITTFADWRRCPEDPELTQQLREAWQTAIDKFKDRSFYNSVKTSPDIDWSERQMAMFGTLGVGTGGFGPLFPITMLEILRIGVGGWSNKQKTISQGMQRLPEAFYSRAVTLPSGERVSLSDCTQTRTRIEAIERDEHGKPRLRFEDGRPAQSFDAVVVATTTRVMSRLGLTLPPPHPREPGEPHGLPSNAQQAIRSLHSVDSSKLFIRTATKFWLDEDGNKCMPTVCLTDELPRAAYCLECPDSTSGVVLISYTWEDDATRLQSLPPRERYKLLRAYLVKSVPEWGPYLPERDEDIDDDDIMAVDWQTEPDYLGAFKLQHPGQDHWLRDLYFQFQNADNNGLYLAGDGVSWSGGWAEGGLHTALNAASAVARQLGGQLHADYNVFQQQRERFRYDRNVTCACPAPDENA